MDKVFIKGLRADSVIGVHDWERNIRQPLILDIELGADFSRASKSDALADAVDYEAISKRVVEVVGGASFQLIETLADHVATMIQDEFGIQWLRLKVTKPQAVEAADGVGVIIERA